MARIVVLGGCGGIGTVAVQALAQIEDVTELVVADLRYQPAAELAAALGRPGVTADAVDATSPGSLAEVLEGADVVLNCIGPFYRFGPPILEAAIEAGVDYVDVCDDLAPTRHMLELDGRAREKGVSCLVGMGNSPGLANVFVKLCADSLLDTVDSADIMHIHGGEPTEGPAVIKHRIRAMLDEVPLFLDGKMVHVRQLEASGQAHVFETEFRDVGTYPVFPYPHPETITLPQYIPGLKRATNMGVIFPLSYFKLTQDMVRVGACGDQPIAVQGQEVTPIEFSVAHILSQRARLLGEAGIDGPAGCLKVVVSGTKGGNAETYVFSLSSTSAGAGEGTGIPAAAGAVLMARGRITRKGTFPPEAAVDPFEVLLMSLDMVSKLGKGGKDSVHIERIDSDGNSHDVPLPI